MQHFSCSKCSTTFRAFSPIDHSYLSIQKEVNNMNDLVDFKDVLHKAFLAKTPAGRVFKFIVFWISFLSMFVVPLGVVALFYLWKHGASISQSP